MVTGSVANGAVPESTLTTFCGHHCGTVDGRTGHCWCEECHDGEPGYSLGEADGCVTYTDLDGRVTGFEHSETHVPGSHEVARLFGVEV